MKERYFGCLVDTLIIEDISPNDEEDLVDFILDSLGYSRSSPIDCDIEDTRETYYFLNGEKFYFYSRDFRGFLLNSEVSLQIDNDFASNANLRVQDDSELHFSSDDVISILECIVNDSDNSIDYILQVMVDSGNKKEVSAYTYKDSYYSGEDAEDDDFDI